MNAKKDKKPDRFLVSRKYTLANEFFFNKELENFRYCSNCEQSKYT